MLISLLYCYLLQLTVMMSVSTMNCFKLTNVKNCITRTKWKLSLRKIWKLFPPPHTHTHTCVCMYIHKNKKNIREHFYMLRNTTQLEKKIYQSQWLLYMNIFGTTLYTKKYKRHTWWFDSIILIRPTAKGKKNNTVKKKLHSYILYIYIFFFYYGDKMYVYKKLIWETQYTLYNQNWITKQNVTGSLISWTLNSRFCYQFTFFVLKQI